jgi:hypothetical protein
MKAYQVFLMLILTVAVGALFVFGVPQNESAQVATLSAMVTMQQQTIQFLQQQPTTASTATPQLATPTDSFLQAPVPTTQANNFVPTPLVTFPPFPGDGEVSGSRVVNVQTALNVTEDGCISSPQSTFSPTDTIYGVVLVADTVAGDQLSVSFNYDTGNILIYEDSFTISDGGSFCRWYTVEPDSVGWSGGTYTVSYQLNDSAPVTTTYSISMNDGGVPEATEETMTE